VKQYCYRWYINILAKVFAGNVVPGQGFSPVLMTLLKHKRGVSTYCHPGAEGHMNTTSASGEGIDINCGSLKFSIRC
jgi:hypothetical protein